MGNVRAVLESQFLSMMLHGGNIGISPRRILATGGASKDRAVIRVMSDVFGVPVYLAEQTDTASLGAAYRALHGWLCDQKGRFISFAQAMEGAPAPQMAAEPDMYAHEVYLGMLPKYKELEERIIGG